MYLFDYCMTIVLNHICAQVPVFIFQLLRYVKRRECQHVSVCILFVYMYMKGLTREQKLICLLKFNYILYVQKRTTEDDYNRAAGRKIHA